MVGVVMSFLNTVSREINCKLVYCGPGLCGKTTNVRYIHSRSDERARGQLISLATEAERTLFFDFCPLALGRIGGYKVRLHIYTVPGQVFYHASRKLILKNADGLVFVADSQRSRLEANVESMDDLQVCLRDNDIDVANVPLVLQCNKQDMREPMAIAEIQQQLGLEGVPTLPAVAATGAGVFETLKVLSKAVLHRISNSSQRSI
jgi:signal recognition particle receptor subunit beta